MKKIRVIQGIRTRVLVCVDDAVKHNHSFHDREQGISSRVRDHNCESPTPSFQRSKEKSLSCCATSTFAFSRTSEITLVNFHFASERRSLFHSVCNDFPLASEKSCGGFAVHTNNLCFYSSSFPGNEVPNESRSFLEAKSAFPNIGIILASANRLS
jgi:hypothetical protein